MYIKAAVVCAALLLPAAAHAQVCAAPAAQPGQHVRGPVLQVLDAGRLCVATGADRTDWVELFVRGGDDGPIPVEDRLGPALLMSVAFGHDADCAVGLDARGRKVADCRIDGRPLDELLRRPGAVQAARAWVKRPAADAPVLLASR